MSASLVFFPMFHCVDPNPRKGSTTLVFKKKNNPAPILSFFPANFTLEPSYFFCCEVFSCLISVVHIGHTDSLIASQPSHAFVSAISAVLTVDSYPVFTCLKGPSLMLFIHCMWVWLDIFICSCPPPPMMNEIGQIFQD